MRAFDYDHVVIADSSVFECLGVAGVLRRALNCRQTTTANDFAGLKEAIGTHTRLAVIDVDLIGLHSAEQIADLRSRSPDLLIAILYADLHSRNLAALLDSGVQGFIPKRSDPDGLITAFRAVADGQLYMPSQLWSEVSRTRAAARENAELQFALSARQEQVLSLASCGLSNKEIGAQLSISESTVKVHMSAVLRVLHVSSRGRAVAMLKARQEPELFGYAGPAPRRRASDGS